MYEYMDLIDLEGLEEVLAKARNRKAAGLDGVNSELIKYVRIFM